jgi:hypothetical protein
MGNEDSPWGRPVDEMDRQKKRKTIEKRGKNTQASSLKVVRVILVQSKSQIFHASLVRAVSAFLAIYSIRFPSVAQRRGRRQRRRIPSTYTPSIRCPAAPISNIQDADGCSHSAAPPHLPTCVPRSSLRIVIHRALSLAHSLPSLRFTFLPSRRFTSLHFTPPRIAPPPPPPLHRHIAARCGQVPSCTFSLCRRTTCGWTSAHWASIVRSVWIRTFASRTPFLPRLGERSSHATDSVKTQDDAGWQVRV